MTIAGSNPAGEASAAKVRKLAGMIDYQEASVVSRTIIDRKTGTVTLFAFDEGQGLSEHTAPFDAMVYVLDGMVTITIDGRPFELGSGDTITMPAGRPHALHALGKFKMMLIMIRA